jgi:hypothetical protein
MSDAPPSEAVVDPTVDPEPVHEPVIRKPIQLKLLVVLVGVLIGFAAVDQVVAYVDRDVGREARENSPVQPDFVLGWTNRPHFENPKFQTVLDRFGNRNPEIPEDARLDELRIAAYGASRMYGAEGALQPEVWNYKLEQQLRSGGADVRVINGAVMGYSSAQAAERGSTQVGLLEPDLVILLVSSRGQMLLDPHGSLQWRRFGDSVRDVVPYDVVEGFPKSLWPTLAAVHNFMARNSAIYRRSRARFQIAGTLDQKIQAWCLSRAPMPSEVRDKVEQTLERIELLARQVEQQGGEFRALVMPEAYMDKPIRWQNHLRGTQDTGAPPLGTPREEPNETLIEMLAERGVRAWNFFEEGDRMGQGGERFYMDAAGHWSHDGHSLIARGIANRILEEGLLEELAARRAANPRSRAFGDPSVLFVAPEEGGL